MRFVAARKVAAGFSAKVQSGHQEDALLPNRMEWIVLQRTYPNITHL